MTTPNNTVVGLAEKLRFMVADGRNMGVNERTIDLAVLEEAAAALASPAPSVSPAVEDGLPRLPPPAMQARAVKNGQYEDLVADPTGDAVVFKDDALYTAEQMRAYGEQCRRLAASHNEELRSAAAEVAERDVRKLREGRELSNLKPGRNSPPTVPRPPPPPNPPARHNT